jgi:hypothetical protein
LEETTQLDRADWNAPSQPEVHPERMEDACLVNPKHVFLSYCHDNAKEVARLYDDLTGAGLTVWWDQQIRPGEDWKLTIRTAMKNSSAVVLCLSAEAQQRVTTGIYPEVSDAIEIYRMHRPGEVFLIPVRLNDCEIPPVPIDSLRYLDSLQHMDLFPADNREEGLARLIAARIRTRKCLRAQRDAKRRRAPPRSLGKTNPSELPVR